jgi:hypothetical protein
VSKIDGSVDSNKHSGYALSYIMRLVDLHVHLVRIHVNDV